MDLLDLLRLMVRRWYVAAPVVVLTLGAALVVGSSIQPEYKTSAAVLLVPPTTNPPAPAPNASPQPGNPWLKVGEVAMAQAVQISVSAADARQKVQAAGGDPGYEIGLVNRSSIVTVDVTATTHEAALATVIAVTKLISDEVSESQEAYKPKAGEEITTEILDPGTEITPSRSNVLRAQIVVVAIGLLFTAVAAVVYDAIQRRRTVARAASRQSGRRPVADDAGQASVAGGRRGAPHQGGSRSPEVTQAFGNGRGGQQISADFIRAPQSDDTILLTAVRTPTDDSKR
ncbi:hypothetical protein [Polymorphospora rubra]|uniref:Lipopolysaccharide biosynthesis protein n=1 Tax=Polymorphospora rubra TaxID=338584 RepID=A0A810N056_9ACTN|nr:hypothetical protein [Polymorphospora rubra]BCJ66782.1 hypothetical protein Prubr_38030 [Polymorphospora rubra]